MSYSLRLLKIIAWMLYIAVLLRGAASSRASPPFYGEVVKLPVIDKEDIRFTPVLTDGEPLQGGVVSIAQDNYGFLWLAGHGLYRHDGYSIKPYRHEPADPESLADESVSVVFKDRAGILWVGTNSSGLDRLDPSRDSFVHYRHEPGNERSLSDNRVARIYEDHNGVLWVGTYGGLDRMDTASGTFIHYRHDPKDSDSLSSDAITALFEDRKGDLWVGTDSGLNKLDRTTGRFSRFLPDPADPRSVGHNYVFCIREDHAGVLWVAIGSWLSSFDRGTGRFTHFSFHAEEPGSQAVEGVTSIYEDRDGVLWLGTVENGLLKLDGKRKKFIRYAREPGNPTGLQDNLVSAVFEDAEGVLWVGTENGLSRFVRKPAAFVNYRHETRNPQSLPDNSITSVLADSKGFLWIAGAGKLSRLDRKTGELTVYRHNPKDRHSLPSNPIFAIREDRSGTLWLGTYGGGLNRLDRETGRFFAYRHEPKRPGSLSSDLVLSLLEDRQGRLWVGTQGGGLNRLDPVTGRFACWRNNPRDRHSLSHDNVIAMIEDRAGVLWLGTLDGLNRFDPGTGQFQVYRHDARDPHSLSHNKVNAIWEDRQGTLWIGTENGLNQLDKSHGTFTGFTRQNGLPDNKIQYILEDDQRYLWLVTNNGLSRFHPQTSAVRNYSESDGLPGRSIGRGCRAQNGEMIFASNNGLTTFYPDRLSPNAYIPPVVLTDFYLFNRPVHPGEHSPLRKAVWAADSVTLTHSQSIFTIEFAALSYAAPEKNRYRYRLEGLESDWNEVDNRRRVATYTSLPPGRYIFRVQASNNDGFWNQAGIALAIRILPPWWATWWFSGIAILTVAGLAFSVYRSRVKSLQLAASRLEVQVSERTGQLLKQTHELRIAKDAAEAANRSKTVFLANMSHELRTPLNAILGLSNLLRDDDVSEKQRSDLDIINRSGEHLLNLIDEVLDVAKIEAGRGVLEVAPCDLTGLVREVIDMMRVRAEAKQLRLRIVQSGELPVCVRVDAPKVRQVLINLVGNAIKYTEKGSVTLRLHAGEADRAGRFLLKFCVEDTGAGIAHEDRARIFEAFVQIGKPAAQKGTGLGLTITRQFVELMGGVIHVESTPGEGSRFCVELPAERAEESETMAPGAEAKRVVDLQPGESRYRILIVDDERENRTVLERLLRNAGFLVRAATDGAQAVELFGSWRPQFIWMDLRMPSMDGVEAVRHIRALAGGRDVKIAAVSASVFSGQHDEVLAAGLDDFVRKPYRPADIFECLARHLGVQYRCLEVRASREEPAAALPREAIATLPAELRAELRDALVALRVDRIAEMIDRVRERDSALGAALARCADRLAYTAIFQALEGGRAKSSGESFHG
jgi:signal transduction histidine kinase/ligand-binding sensor domain-containing protein/DNA-binding NarL/FixJ family response regulator